MIEKKLKAFVRELKLDQRQEVIVKTKINERIIEEGFVYEILDLHLKEMHFFFDHGVRLFILIEEDSKCLELFPEYIKSRDFVLHQHKIKSEKNIKSRKCINIVINDEESLLKIINIIVNNAYKEVNITV